MDAIHRFAWMCLLSAMILPLVVSATSAGLRGPKGAAKFTPLSDKTIDRENKFNATLQEYRELVNSPNPPPDIKDWGTSPEKSIEKMLSMTKKAKNAPDRARTKGAKPIVLRQDITLGDESPRRRGGDKEPGRGWVNTPKVGDGDGGIGKVSADEPVRSRHSFEDDAEARSARRGDAALNRPGRSLDDEWEKRNVEDVPELQEEVLRETKERDRIKSEEARAEQKAEEGANAEPADGRDADKLLADAGSTESAIDPKTGRPMKGKPGSPKSGAPKKPGAAGSKPSIGKPKGGASSGGSSGSKGTLSQAQIRAIYAKDKD